MSIPNCVPEYYREQEEKERNKERKRRINYLNKVRRVRKEGTKLSKEAGEGKCHACNFLLIFNKRAYCDGTICERYEGNSSFNNSSLESYDGGCYEDYLDVSATERNSQDDFMPFWGKEYERWFQIKSHFRWIN